MKTQAVKPKARSIAYRPCACRDCMETAIGTEGALCHECEHAQCERTRECSVQIMECAS